MRVRIADLMNRQDVLFGTEMGRACLAKMVAETRETQEPEALFLDFGDVAAATVSFLREGPLAYRRMLREGGSTLYPVFSNLAPPVMDSLGEYLTLYTRCSFCVRVLRGGWCNAGTRAWATRNKAGAYV